MPSAKYHREQAQVLAGLALSTSDALQADRFTQAAMEHLAQAQEDEVIHPRLSRLVSLRKGTLKIGAVRLRTG